MSKIPMTKTGEQKLRAILDKLKNEDRPKIIEAIAEARAHGDLKENAEYHSAREQQGFIEGRIQELEFKLANANVIDVANLPKNGRVVFGVTVELKDIDTDETLTYKIVGADEANVSEGLISNTSPIASALFGKSEGDEVEVVVPSGKRFLEIIAVKYI